MVSGMVKKGKVRFAYEKILRALTTMFVPDS